MSNRTIIIKPGEVFILPKGATVDSMIIDGSITVSSTCNNLPTPSSYKCGYFEFVCDVDSNEGHSMDEAHTIYQSLTVGGNTYVMNKEAIDGENPGSLVGVTDLNTFVTDQVLFSFTAINRLVLDKRQYIRLFFKTPDSLWDTVELQINNWETTSTYKPIEWDCDSYPVRS